jgi:histidyl-tRNA synthetase
VIETKTSITELYGEEFNKLVYTLSDSNDKLNEHNIFMRYDLTLPFARYITMNNLKHIRRYQIGKVYRKDDPQISKGRYREFYQCDFDIIDVNNETRINEYEILDLFDNVLNKLLNDTYLIKFNDRRFIKELLNKCNILDDDITTVSTVLDKLGKKSFDELKQELLDKKINEISINQIFKIYNDIQKTNYITYFENLGIDSIKYIKQILQLNISNKIIFDPFIIRGMDYYTGIIFEAEYTNKELMPSSIGGGGMFTCRQ